MPWTHGNGDEPLTSAEEQPLLLLDEHYPGWLALRLSAAGIDTVALVAHRIDLRGADDVVVLRAARDEHRVVVTEDVATFRHAINEVVHHVGVVFCHRSRFPRSPDGLHRLGGALRRLAAERPPGLGTLPVEWWLER